MTAQDARMVSIAEQSLSRLLWLLRKRLLVLALMLVLMASGRCF